MQHGILDWILAQKKKGISGKASEIWKKFASDSNVPVLISYFDKCTMVT